MRTRQKSTKTLRTALFAAILLTASSALFAQVKIGTNPTTIEPTSNFEVEASTPGRKVKVDKTTGQLTIKDGTEGFGKILTSDANGAASWGDLPGTVIITGTNNSALNVIVDAPSVNSMIVDCPITLNRGIYTLYYYAQFDYFNKATGTARIMDPTNTTTVKSTWPVYVYFDFVATSGAAVFPSYYNNTGPHIVPTINSYQTAAKISQLVNVTQDGTVIKPRFYGIGAYGQIGNVSPIIAVKM